MPSDGRVMEIVTSQCAECGQPALHEIWLYDGAQAEINGWIAPFEKETDITLLYLCEKHKPRNSFPQLPQPHDCKRVRFIWTESQVIGNEQAAKGS